MTKCIAAIDQGTSSTKVLLVDRSGNVLARGSRPVGLSHPRVGWVEQSADDLWASVLEALADAIAACPQAEIAGIGISNQRETVVLWDRITGRPVAPAIIWQCRRTSDRCAALRASGHAGTIARHTGLGIDPLFPAAKIEWLLDSNPDWRARAERGELACGTVDSWLLWNLTAGAVHATDHSNASRTQLFNLDRLEWDQEMLSLFRVPHALLPHARPSNSRFGTVSAGIDGIPEGAPIHAMLGDSHASMAGHGFTSPGSVKVTCGTGSSMMVLTPERLHSHNGLSSTIAWTCGDSAQYALEGNISVSGQAAAFAVRLLNLKDEDELTRLAQSVTGSDGVTFVPALAGLGAPYWQDMARGQLGGMSLGTTSGHVSRAVFEGIALQILDVFAAMGADLGTPPAQLSIDGGAARNNFLAQMIADMVGGTVLRPSMTDLSALGAARFAQLAMGWIDELPACAAADSFAPAMADIDRDTIVTQWKAAIRRVTLDLHGPDREQI
ncbi:FGGY family carbohydrate kinase [Novosphingobium sp. MW5]|nr:FGGY family carbohydrate kinase [Novosphingobium sp. MW5]